MMRSWGVWGALACTLFACWWVDQSEQTPDSLSIVDGQKPRIQRRVTLSQAMPAVKVDKTISPPASYSPIEEDDIGTNLFGVLPMPIAESAESETPVAVNPYSYAGRLQEGGRWLVFLTDGQQQYVLHVGDQFAESWKLVELDQQKMVLLHGEERFEMKLDSEVVF